MDENNVMSDGENDHNLEAERIYKVSYEVYTYISWKEGKKQNFKNNNRIFM